MDEWMGDPFGGDEQQGKEGERELQEFRSLLFWSDRADTPLGFRAGAEGVDSPEHVEVDEGTDYGDDHHRNADSVLMEAGGGSMYAHGRRAESAEADGDADATDRDDCAASALQQDEDEAGEVHEPGFCVFCNEHELIRFSGQRLLRT